MAMDVGWCRHCGDETEMSREHIPPEATGNDSAFTLYQQFGNEVKVFREFTNGHALETLCVDCNGGASERGLPQAYTAWHQDVLGHVHRCGAAYRQVTGGDPNDLWSLTRPDGAAFTLPLEHGRGVDRESLNNLHPGRIARQILGGILAVQDTRRLLADHPQLQAAYFNDEPTSIAPFTLHVALANVGTAYMNTSASTITIDLVTGASTADECWILALSPFLMILVNGDESPVTATRIDHWFQRSTKVTFGRRQDRTVNYPIARRDELLVNTLHDGLDRLPPNPPDQ
ncbi:HNH endonuclease [Nocardia africana]|uniref:HNH endonuclease n=2 Tax=Nocardia africana TaxID=134964 RepID=UPI001D152594|nr:HNH endonuclease [Nocardia africana]MCC3318340.1 HNH endonuclease [Nocardia africana]